jgi:hypothetical protein
MMLKGGETKTKSLDKRSPLKHYDSLIPCSPFYDISYDTALDLIIISYNTTQP